MSDFLHRVILDNTVLAFIICFGTIGIALVLRKYLSIIATKAFLQLIKRTKWQIGNEKNFIELLIAPMQAFLLVLISFIALDKLAFPRALIFDIHKITTRDIIDSVGVGLLIVTFIWLILRLIDFISMILQIKANATLDTRDNQLVVYFRDFLKVITGIIGVLLIIHFSFHRDVGALLAGFGLAGAALALAARESLENLIASFIIFFDKPFAVGDLVKVQQIQGTVEKIGLRSTRIRTEAKTFVTVPNKQMVDSIMDNLTLRTQRRADLQLDINLDTTPEKLEELIAAVRNITDYAPIISRSVFLNDISINAYKIKVEYYTGIISPSEFNEVKQHVNLAVAKALEDLKVELAGLSTTIQISNPPKPPEYNPE
jgi:MscS family membrane protein